MVSARSAAVICASAGPIWCGRVGQVRAGQLAEPREVASADWVIGTVRGHERHPVLSGGPRDREWTGATEPTSGAARSAVAAVIVTSGLGVLVGRRWDGTRPAGDRVKINGRRKLCCGGQG
jgi:hypothetical protein